MKNISEGLTSKLDTGEVRNSELEDISLESTKAKTRVQIERTECGRTLS